MSDIAELSTCMIVPIMIGEEVEKPVVQILGTQLVTGVNSHCYRLFISDGEYLCNYAYLSMELNNMHDEGELCEFTIVRLERYITLRIGKSFRRVLIIFDLTILNPGSYVGKKIGEPGMVDWTECTEDDGDAARPADIKAVPLLAFNNNNECILMSYVSHHISNLSRYQKKWIFKASVISKSSIRTRRSGGKGGKKGKLFTADLVDESGEMFSATFKEQCDKFYHLLDVGSEYLISKSQLKPVYHFYTALTMGYDDETNELESSLYFGNKLNLYAFIFLFMQLFFFLVYSLDSIL